MSDCDPPDASCPHVLMHRTTMMIHSRSPSCGSHTAVCVSVVLGMISVSIRRARRGKRMMKVGSLLTVDQVQFFISQEDELSQADTVSTVMETSSYSGLPDSFYSNYIRKVNIQFLWQLGLLVVLRARCPAMS